MFFYYYSPYYEFYYIFLCRAALIRHSFIHSLSRAAAVPNNLSSPLGSISGSSKGIIIIKCHFGGWLRVGKLNTWSNL